MEEAADPISCSQIVRLKPDEAAEASQNTASYTRQHWHAWARPQLRQTRAACRVRAEESQLQFAGIWIQVLFIDLQSSRTSIIW